MIWKSTTRRRPIAATLVAAIVCFSVAHGDEAATPDDPYVAAQADFNAERWAEAIVSIRAAVKAAPDDPRAIPIRMYLAEALFRDHQPADAAKEYRTFLQTADDGDVKSLARYRLIESLYFADDFPAVVDEAGRFLDDHPRYSEAPRIWTYLGNACSRTGDYAAAEAAMARIATDFPDDEFAEHAALSQASYLLILDQPRAAWAILSVRLKPSAEGGNALVEEVAGNVLKALGDEAIDQNRFDDADAHFDRLMKLFPRHAFAVYATLRRGELAQEQGDWPTAVDRFSEVIKRSGVEAELLGRAWAGRLSCLAQQQDWDEVASLAATAKKQCNQWSRAYEFDYLRGRALFAKAELNDARAAFVLVTASPDSAGTETGVLARFLTAETYRLQQKYELALAEYDAVAAAPLPEWQDEARTHAQRIREHLAALNNSERK